jgi:hypothetical protein
VKRNSVVAGSFSAHTPQKKKKKKKKLKQIVNKQATYQIIPARATIPS